MKFESFNFFSRRSNIIATGGLVATSQPLAAQAGLSILKSGGNAVDAALATAAALCVVEPASTGIGGDAFALIWLEHEKTLYGLNASGPAPQGLSAAAVRALGHTAYPSTGGLPVTVPGSVRGWQAASERFGSLGLDTLLAPAIAYAEYGFPVSQRISQTWARSADKLNQFPESKRIWLPNGRAPKPGELFQNPAFAHSLKALAASGPDIFYEGHIAHQIVNAVNAAGGFLSLADMAGYRPEWVTPLQIEYPQGFTFHEIPPNGQGLAALNALNIVNTFDLEAIGYGSADYYHLLIEAMKLAFADAHRFIADPRQADVPVAGLLSPSYAAERAALINMKQALMPFPGSPARHGDTVYISTADSAGNMVSWIQSLYMSFGSGVTAGQTGIQLQNRGANFSLTAGHPNEASPGKRPYHTIIPGFITKNGEAWSSFGVMGGFMQPQGHLQVGLNLVTHKMDPQTALDAPRFYWQSDKLVAIEPTFSADLRQELSRRGHELWPLDSPLQFGGGQVIVRDPVTGVLIGGSEPRNDGAAVGF